MSLFTNASSLLLATTLASARPGTFTGLVVTKKGRARGPQGHKVRYGDDRVHVTLFTGFRYKALCQRSLDIVEGLDAREVFWDLQDEGLQGWTRIWAKSWHINDLRSVCNSWGLSSRGLKGHLIERLQMHPEIGEGLIKVDITESDVEEALHQLKFSLKRRVANNTPHTPALGVYEPLVVMGQRVRGSRVYRGPTPLARANGAILAAKPGTIYLQGLWVRQAVLSPAVNGPIPRPKSGTVVTVKNAIRRILPIRRYVSYSLEPGTSFRLAAGGAAIVAAEKDGMVFTDTIIQAATTGT